MTYFSWRWIFFINVPLGIVSLWGIGTHLMEMRPRKASVTLDFLGVVTLSTTILSFLFAFLLGGRTYPWISLPVMGLLVIFVFGTAAFVQVELRAEDPILSMEFFTNRGFSTGNGAVFLSSFAIFSMFAFAPLFIQGAQGKSPMQVGMAMLSLSLGWSVGSIALGQVIDRMGRKWAAVAGAVCLMVGCAMTLRFAPHTSGMYSFTSFFIIGIGMGFVALATLMVVQSSVAPRDLGVATSSNQFARTLGGTVGVGVCGSFIATRFSQLVDQVRQAGLIEQIPVHLGEKGLGQIETLLLPEVQTVMAPALKILVQETIGQGVIQVFRVVLVSAILCLAVCLRLPADSSGGGDKTT